MKRIPRKVALAGAVLLLSSCDMFDQIEHRAGVINNYELVALELAKENREMRGQVNRLEFEVQHLKSRNNYLQIQLDKKGKEPLKIKSKAREIASIAPHGGNGSDLVKFDVYKWNPSQVIGIAEKEFDKKNWEKSAQFFDAFAVHFPDNKKIDDQFLFQAGVASFESQKHHDWVIKHLSKLIQEYPSSSYYRASKLWVALTYLKMGNQKKFFKTVEEFRKKYRNTGEWKILSQHYERIVQKYK